MAFVAIPVISDVDSQQTVMAIHTARVLCFIAIASGSRITFNNGSKIECLLTAGDLHELLREAERLWPESYPGTPAEPVKKEAATPKRARKSKPTAKGSKR